MDLTHSVEPSPPHVSTPQRRRTFGYVVVALASLGIGAVISYVALERRALSAAPGSGRGTTPEMVMGSASQAAPPANAVYISPGRQQLVGVRTAVVENLVLRGTIRTVGTLQFDETRVTEVHPKTAGWVDRVDVDYVGKAVRRGAPLFRIYSPDLVTSQNDVLVAIAARDGAISPDAKANAAALLAAARERLKRWDVPEAELDRLERTREVSKFLTLYSPFDGVVLERNAFPGQYLTPESAAFKIGDVSTVWVVGEVFEYELARVHVGQEIGVEFPYGQAATALKGKIAFVSPDVDPQTRRAKVRAIVKNPGLALKPQTYVTIVIQGDSAQVLAVPREAILDSGTRRYALLALDGGYFEPHDVEIGAPEGDFYPVLKGLARGDRVVTSAQFLIDSETNLKSAMTAMAMSMPGMDMSGDKSGMDMTGGNMAGMAMPDAGAPKDTASPKSGAAPMKMPDMSMGPGAAGADTRNRTSDSGAP